ncbi:MAG: hypothetical protein A2W69_01470 [Gammaproteobacteria bacterium RIFCSPLOWO2_02_47_7]|jgi:hypothetical protein|nr:MAG: hypothetical protein A2993_04505 [Gammaproteobacteria bacterium RIFCSPLOWO2_01_FULL_47_190]OGT65546.1 MAG: hypothetical protein A2W69_01470 [Gammaproteobacteria bacterium RIFCSPLOWO2_02_47_7]OGT72926.1 MAG: hypothetical protein A2W76_02545 [Gammaproteobacteria bacterium RIFCSPLOWO2_12_47_11]OGT82854.1 MAG: hypothetical protein A3G42_02095 [Gammaproteobacteria bacterium RIFCSPLOWO2_12_FULL_47_76]
MEIEMKYEIYTNETLPVAACFGLILLIFISPLSAAPSAVDLLDACEHSLQNGFQGIKGDVCIWYVTPCDCDYGKTKEMPRVCLPDSVPVESLARIVVRGLKEQPGLHMENADYAAAMILSRIYPCSE